VNQAYSVLIDPEQRARYAEQCRSQGAPVPGDPAGRALASDRYFRTGEQLLRKRRFADASKAFRRAAELSRDSAEYHAYLGWALYQNNPQDEAAALAELDAAIACDPKLDRAHLFLGYLHRDAGRHQPAELHFEKAIQCNPDCVEAVHELRL